MRRVRINRMVIRMLRRHGFVAYNGKKRLIVRMGDVELRVPQVPDLFTPSKWAALVVTVEKVAKLESVFNEIARR